MAVLLTLVLVFDYYPPKYVVAVHNSRSRETYHSHISEDSVIHKLKIIAQNAAVIDKM